MKTTYELFIELKEKFSIQEIAEILSLHIGTLKRWEEKQDVPKNYYNDLNSLLGNKYEAIDTYRARDQFYTLPKIANYCFELANKKIVELGVDLFDYVYLEPSAGCCSFYELLPKHNRIGIDIDPKGYYANELIKSDYLKYVQPINKKYIVIGNPPFGLRGNLALRFINHSYEFADFVAFILPPLFDSTGKGVPMKRVKGYKLIYSEKLPLNSYCYPNGENLSIATIFQIWSKFGNYDLSKPKIYDTTSFFKVFSMSNGSTPSSKRNVKKIGSCDFYLPSTCFSGMKIYESFDKLPNHRGYGIEIYKNKTKILDIAKKINWEEISFLSTNSALNLRTDLIINALVEGGALEDND